MSRRPQNPGAERAAQNQQTLKTLVKIESNKTCADCKRNKHPRWASWNLGVFLCIRCSGIHRGMGTHISRVKSVDLDAWTDEQLQSILKWGNARANKYWEAKLAPGHAPSEAKIENFIRTKYDSKRWVMDGPMPDPSTLDAEGDDEMPLNVVQEKAKMERSTSLRASSNPPQTVPVPSTVKAPMVDLFADDTPSVPQRPNSAAPVTSGPSAAPALPPKQPTHAQKPSKGGESLLGFDFFSNAQPAPTSRPSSGASGTTSSNAPSRPDLKQSILSLYSSAPKQSSNTQQQISGSDSASSHTQQPSGSGLSDAFSSLSFGAPSVQPAKPVTNPSSSLSSPPIQKSTPAEPRITSPGFSGIGGGGFFDSKPKAQVQPHTPGKLSGSGGSSGFGDFGDFTSAQPSQPNAAPKATAQGNGLGDLFDFSAPSPQAPAPKPGPSASSTTMGSPFNLSSPKPQTQPPTSNPPPIQAPASTNTMNSSNIMSDPWGSNDAWASSTSNTSASVPTPTPKSTSMPLKSPPITIASTSGDWGGGWGESPTAVSKPAGGFSPGFGAPSPPKVTADEDYGGWEEAAPAPVSASSNPPPPPPKPMGFSGGGEDLFSNVWE